jgi:RNA polymerase sigma-70 factor (ECF subfamily)
MAREIAMLDTLVLKHVATRRLGPMIGRRNDSQAAEDARAVQAVLAGDLHVFRELYDRYVRLIRAVCHDFTHDRHRTQDLVHEVFLKAYQRLRQLRQPAQFGPWLLKIARHACCDWQRQRARDPHVYVGLEPDGGATTTNTPDERIDALKKALTRLPERERLAIHLAYLEEQPAEHARRLLGLSQSGFYRVLDRARAKLERMLSEDEEVDR